MARRQRYAGWGVKPVTTNSRNRSRNASSEHSLELAPNQEQLVRVEGLKKYFPIKEGILQRKVDEVRAVDDVSFTIPKGTTFGLVGESGSGKTTLVKSVIRLLEPTSGRVEIAGQDVTEMSSSQLKAFRKNMQMVFQDPTSSLNPRKRIRDILMEPLEIHDIGTKSERIDRVEELLTLVDLPQDFMYKYPNALSGGQKQRVGIARATALDPQFIVLDEPTSALDVSVQARVLQLFDDLQDELNLTYLFISHDLPVVKEISDWVGVMYLGRLVEVGPVERVFEQPHHPYTRALLSTIKVVSESDRRSKPDQLSLEGEIPDPREKPSGCGFRSRCPKEFDHCSQTEPSFQQVGDNHYARCFLHDPACTQSPDW